jgi:hypothetical protein
MAVNAPYDADKSGFGELIAIETELRKFRFFQ